MTQRARCSHLFILVMGGGLCATWLVASARAMSPAESNAANDTGAPIQNASVEMRTGGVLQESYGYHRQGYGTAHAAAPFTPHPTMAQPNGWYGYGFPVQTYRWGWFGASSYRPRVVWHRGYYDDCCRWAYRRGY